MKDNEPHVLWNGQLRAKRSLPWYYEDGKGHRAFCLHEPIHSGIRYRREWPKVGKWKTIPCDSATPK